MIEGLSSRSIPQYTNRIHSHIDPGKSPIPDDAPDSLGDARARNTASEFASLVHRRSLVPTQPLGALGAEPLLNGHVFERRSKALKMESERVNIIESFDHREKSCVRVVVFGGRGMRELHC